MKIKDPKTFIVALMGYAGVGKDAIAAALGYPTASFAKELKADLAPLLYKHAVNLNNRAHKDKVRPLLVEYGRTMRRLYPLHWVDRIEIPDAPIVVITDLRYVNEASAVKRLGGLVVQVVRPGVGPANEEEDVSIDAVLRAGLCNHTLHNLTTVEEAAEALRTWLPRQDTMEVKPKPHQRCGNVRIGHASPMEMAELHFPVAECRCPACQRARKLRNESF